MRKQNLGAVNNWVGNRNLFSWVPWNNQKLNQQYTDTPKNNVPDCRHFKNIPFDWHVEFAQVHAFFDDVGVVQFVEMSQVDLLPRIATK